MHESQTRYLQRGSNISETDIWKYFSNHDSSTFSKILMNLTIYWQLHYGLSITWLSLVLKMQAILPGRYRVIRCSISCWWMEYSSLSSDLTEQQKQLKSLHRGNLTARYQDAPQQIPGQRCKQPITNRRFNTKSDCESIVIYFLLVHQPRTSFRWSGSNSPFSRSKRRTD